MDNFNEAFGTFLTPLHIFVRIGAKLKGSWTSFGAAPGIPNHATGTVEAFALLVILTRAVLVISLLSVSEELGDLQVMVDAFAKHTKNVYELLNKGGYFLVIVPFLIRVHNVPIDCSRWTEDGLKYHLEESGFKIENIFTNSWGNKKCVISNLRNDDSWSRIWFYRSLKNEKKFPVQVWAIAKKD